MGVLYDVKLMLLDHGADLISKIESEKGQQLIVEWHRRGHVLNGYLDVVNDRLHALPDCSARSSNETQDQRRPPGGVLISSFIPHTFSQGCQRLAPACLARLSVCLLIVDQSGTSTVWQ